MCWHASYPPLSGVVAPRSIFGSLQIACAAEEHCCHAFWHGSTHAATNLFGCSRSRCKNAFWMEVNILDKMTFFRWWRGWHRCRWWTWRRTFVHGCDAAIRGCARLTTAALVHCVCYTCGLKSTTRRVINASFKCATTIVGDVATPAHTASAVVRHLPSSARETPVAPV